MYMQKIHDNLLKSLEQTEPPKYLYLNIIERIRMEKERSSRIRFWVFSGITLASFLTAIPALQYSIDGLSQSGTMQYLSLIFSDGTTLLTYWQEFALTIAESLPIIWLAALFASIFAMLGSIKLAFENRGSGFAPAKLSIK